MRELVDKQLMLEDVKSWVAMDSYEQHLINNMSEWIENLPTVEASDGDCISRRVVIETISRMMPKSYTLDGSHPADEEIFMAQEIYADCIKAIEILPTVQPQPHYDEWCNDCKEYDKERHCCPRWNKVIQETLKDAQPEIIRCKDCKHWRQQTNYQGAPLSFGFCESKDMWASLYGETTEVEHIDTDDNHYCGYAERRTDERTN